MGASGGDGGFVQVSPAEIQSAASVIGLSVDPLDAAGSTVGGAHVALPGFAMSDAANAFSAKWAAALSGLAGQVSTAAGKMSTTGSIYIDQEAGLTGMFGV